MNDTTEILVVEDSPTQAAQLKFLLQEQGYTVAVAVTGKAALGAARKRTPKLIIADVSMPVMNGYDMCRAIKNDPSLSDIPVILLTVLSDPEDIIRVLESRAECYLTKPYAEGYLLSKVKALLAAPVRQTGQAAEEGITVSLAGKSYVVTSNRRQILDLLLSTYENTVQQQRELFQLQREQQSPLDKVTHSQHLLLALSQAAQAVQRAHTPEEIYRSVGDQVAKLGYHAAVFALADDGAHLRIPYLNFNPTLLHAAETLTGLSAQSYRFLPEKDSFFRQVLCERKALFFEPATQLIAEGMPKVTRPLAGPVMALLNIKQAIVAPLVVDDEVRGVLVVTGTGLTEADVPAVTAFAGQTVIALENSRLYQSIQQQIEALRESEEKFRILFEQATDSILLLEITPEGIPVIQDANSATFKFLGYARDELIGQLVSFIEAAPDAAKVVEKRWQNILSGMGQVFEVKHRCKGGTIREFECSVTEVQIGSKAFALSVERDITARKRAEQALQEYSEQLEDMVAERTQELRQTQEQLLRREKLAVLGQLTGGIGHELRGPLGVIKNSVYLLSMILEDRPPDPEIKEALDYMHKGLETSERIINSLLDYARSKAPVQRKVDINSLVQETLAQAAAPAGVEVIHQLDESLPAILADPDQLAQVFGNLIGNAIQAMPNGGQLTVTSCRGDSSCPDAVAVSVADTGVGIPPENLNKLFEPLFTTKSKGIGLGLALAKTLVEGHDGTIEVKSEVGRGSTFTVWLPVAQASA